MLAELVREHRDDVVEIALQRLRELAPGRPPPEPHYFSSLFDQLVSDMEQGRAGDDASSLSTAAASHGRSTQRLGIDLHFLAHDFGVVCDAVSEMALRTNTTFDAAEWQKLNRAIDQGISQAILGYEEGRQDHERQTTAAELGSFAHELRNALAAAMTGFEAVKLGRVGTDSRTAEIVTRNLKRAALLASNLLVESKVEAGMQPVREELHVPTLLEHVVAGLTVGGEVSVHIAADADLTISADEHLVTSALTNLVQNALKFTPRGGKVEIRAGIEGEATVIEVEDECGGLPPGRVETLFKPFVQAGSDRSGAGLGLSIVQKVMAAHGGTASARDLPGRGCVFTVRFPRQLPV